MKEGRHVLIVGDSFGIGWSIANRLALQGYRITLFCHGGHKGDLLVPEGISVVDGDAAAATDRARLVDLLMTFARGLHGLVIALGTLYTARLSETSDADWDAVLDANAIAPTLVVQACLPHLLDGGSIVFIGSGTAQWPEMELGAYSVAKRMLERMAQVLAMEAALRDMRVNVVNPGEMPGLGNAVAASSVRQLPATPIPPLGRHGEPDDVAAAVEFFLSDGASFCTGASLTVDGGVRAALRSHRVRQ